MYRGLLPLTFVAVTLAQVQSQEDPIQVAIKEYQTARDQGRFNEAVTKREAARALLDKLPGDDPQFGYSVRNVAQLYQASGLPAKALAIELRALERATDTNRAELLGMVAESYQQDRNLLQALVYREKVVAALDEAASKAALPVE